MPTSSPELTPDATAICSLARWVDQTELLEAIQRASPDVIDSALQMVDDKGDSLLINAAKNFKPHGLLALVQKASSHILSIAVLHQDYYKTSPLYWAVMQPIEVLSAFIDKLSNDALERAVLLEDVDGCNALYIMALKLPHHFPVITDKLSEACINKSIEQRSGTDLLKAAFRQRSNVPALTFINKASLQILVPKLSADMFSLIVTRADCEPLLAICLKLPPSTLCSFFEKTSNGDMHLLLMAEKQNREIWEVILNVASPALLQEGMKRRSRKGESLLSLAAKAENDIFVRTLSHLDESMFQNAPLNLIAGGNTLLHVVAAHQKPHGWLTFIQKTSQTYLNQELATNNNETALTLALENQNETGLLALINKASSYALKCALFPHTIPMFRQIARLNATIVTLNKVALRPWLFLLHKLTSSLEPLLSPEQLDEEWLLAKMSTIEDPQLSQLALCLSKQFICLKECNDIPRPFLTSDSVQLTRQIQCDGLLSWEVFYRINHALKTHPNAAELLAMLRMIENYATLAPSKLPGHILDLNQTCLDGLLVAKVFSGWQPQAWPDFIKQLQTPVYRAALRMPKTTSVDQMTHKFYHLENRIRPYPGKEHRTPSHNTHAKKQSATLINRNRSTPLFQSSTNRPLVGVLFRADPNLLGKEYDPCKAKIKAMLGYDLGTYFRRWVGNQRDVQMYSAGIQNFTELATFQESILNERFITNEVLIQPSKASLMGIFVGRNTPDDRHLAEKYQKDIEEGLGISLPIVLYDASQQLLIEDLSLYEKTKEEETRNAKLLLMAVKEKAHAAALALSEKRRKKPEANNLFSAAFLFNVLAHPTTKVITPVVVLATVGLIAVSIDNNMNNTVSNLVSWVGNGVEALTQLGFFGAVSVKVEEEMPTLPYQV